MNINGKRTLNRKERRKAKAKPLASPGVPVHSGVAGITAPMAASSSFGSPPKTSTTTGPYTTWDRWN